MGGFAEIGINLPLLAAFLINFGILVAALTFLLYRPMLKMLDERKARIKTSLEQAEQIQQRLARTEEDVRSRLDTARQEAQAVVNQAVEIGERLKNEARQEAENQTESLIARARREIGREREESLEALRREFVDLSLLAAQKVLGESLDKEKHRRLIEEVLEESAAQGR